MDLDTFLTTLYVLIDDWYKEEILQHKPRHRGGAPEQMSDSEILTLAIAGQWRKGVPWESERSLVRYMQQHGQRWFPRMLQRSAFNRRVRMMCGILAALQREVSKWLGDEGKGYEIVDGLPLPTCTLGHAARQKQHWLMTTSKGHGGNYGGWFFGQRWWVSVTPSGAITGWMVAEAAINERWMLEAFLSQRAGDGQLRGPLPNPQISKKQRPSIPVGFMGGAFAAGKWTKTYLADRGLNGARWRHHWRSYYRAEVLAVPPANTPDFQLWSAADCRWLASHRQPIETAYAFLTDVFGIKRINAHSQWGQYTRLAAKAAAYNLGLFFNRLLQRPLGALATLIC
jgi:hypothetical protein